MFARILDVLFPRRCVGCRRPGDAFCAACRPPPAALRTMFSHGLEVRAAGRYAGSLRRAILAYKSGRRDTGEALAQLLADRMAEALPRDVVLVPIPTVAERRRRRGFDQSVRLARRLADCSGLPVLLALRQVAPDAQCGRSRGERLRARERFRADVPHLVRGASVVLVDDVITTGATLRDAAATLALRGVRVRGAIVLAYA